MPVTGQGIVYCWSPGLDHVAGAIDAVAPPCDHARPTIVGPGGDAEGAVCGGAHGVSHVGIKGCGIARGVFVIWERPHGACGGPHAWTRGVLLGRSFRKGAGDMCVSCGCGEVHDDHGDPRHLTIEDLEQAAEAANLTVDQVVQNIQASGRQGGSSSSSGRRQ